MRAWSLLFVAACGGDGSVSESSESTTMVDATTLTTTTTSTSSDPTTSSTTTSSSSSSTSSSSADESSTGDVVLDAVAIYVASGSAVLPFVVDVDTGALTALDSVDVGATPGPMTHGGERLFVGITDDEAVATYQIAADGSLASVGTTPIGMNPVYLSLAEMGPYLLVADYGADEVASFGVDDAGVVEAGAIVALATGALPHSIVLAPDRRFAFVPQLGENVVGQFAFDGVLGVLSPNGTTTGALPAGAGPRHMVFASDASVAWVVNEDGDSITAWTYDATMGQLAVLQNIDTLPRGVDGSDNYCGDIHVTPDDRFVYASNRGDDTLAMFEVQSDGTLVAIGHVDTEPHVRDFAIEPGGRFLYAAGRDSGMLASYAIGLDGALTPIGTTPVPPQPVWVEAVVLAQ